MHIASTNSHKTCINNIRKFTIVIPEVIVCNLFEKMLKPVQNGIYDQFTLLFEFNFTSNKKEQWVETCMCLL